MNDTARPGRPPRFPRHLHEWCDLGAGIPGDWRYRCARCRRKSRNPYYQLPQFRRTALVDVPTGEKPRGANWSPMVERQAVERGLRRRRARNAR